MNTNAKPHLIVADTPPTGLAATTWESRKGMTPAQLIEAMGPLWIGHKEFRPRPFVPIPMPNLAGKQAVISVTHYGIIAEFRRLIRWWIQ